MNGQNYYGINAFLGYGNFHQKSRFSLKVEDEQTEGQTWEHFAT